MRKRILPYGGVLKLSEELGVNRTHLSLVLHHRVHPSVVLAKRIEAATGGEIKWTSFFEDADLKTGSAA